MNNENILDAIGMINEEAVRDAKAYQRPKSRKWIKWGAMAACLCLVVLVGIKMGSHDNFISLSFNTITDASYSAPAITSTIESVQVTEDDVNAWLGFDLRSNLPKELKDFTMKYYLVQDSEIDKTLGVEIWGEVEDAETPKPQFHIAITEGKVLQDLLFDYDVTTDIDGVTVIAGVTPGETRTNRDGEERYWPARYFSLFDVGAYHCTVETQGQVSEDTFSELNNILIDCLLENYVEEIVVGDNEKTENETVSFHDRTINKSDLSEETLAWLERYNALSSEEQLAISSIPPDLYELCGYGEAEDVEVNGPTE